MSIMDYTVLGAVIASLVLSLRYLVRCRKDSCAGCTKHCTLRKNL